MAHAVRPGCGQAGVELTYLDHAAPAPLEDLWSRDDLGAVFMCGFPFAAADPKPQLVAAPVPDGARYGGLPRYCTDFVVRADSRFAKLDETFGGTIGWTVHHSQSGYHAVRHHLLRDMRDRRQGPLSGEPLSGEHLYREWVGPLLTPKAVIEAVLAGRIDVGPLDSIVHDLLVRHQPGTASRLRTVASTAMTPNPALVASPGVPHKIVQRLRCALLGCGTDPALRTVLGSLTLRGFCEADPASYALLLEQKRAADMGL